MKLRWFAFLIVLLAGCSSKHDYTNPPWNAKVPVQRAMQWMPISQKAGAAWGVDPQLITAIIAIESGGNPNAVSKSNAIGLMQLKASTSGRDVYRRMGWSGEPTTSELKNPERNISMGAAYLNILETGPLAGIEDRRYCNMRWWCHMLTGQVRCYGLSRQIGKRRSAKSTIWMLMSSSIT